MLTLLTRVQLIWAVGGSQGLYRIGEGLQGSLSRNITGASVNPLTGDLWIVGNFGLDDMVWGSLSVFRDTAQNQNPHAHCFLVALSYLDGHILWVEAFHGALLLASASRGFTVQTSCLRTRLACQASRCTSSPNSDRAAQGARWTALRRTASAWGNGQTWEELCTTHCAAVAHQAACCAGDTLLQCQDISHDSQGNAFVSGRCVGTCTFGSQVLATQVLLPPLQPAMASLGLRADFEPDNCDRVALPRSAAVVRLQLWLWNRALPCKLVTRRCRQSV